MMNFSEFGLDPSLSALLEENGYAKATTIQEMVIPEALLGKDIMAGAETGTGKTLAFAVPCIQHILDFPKRKSDPRVLILTPTRELAAQVGECFMKLAGGLGIKVAYVIGGVGYKEQEQSFEEGVDIIVATPGRLLEYVRNKAFLGRTIEILVIDEADRMLDMGFIDDVGRIAECTDRRDQTMLFSATLEGADVERFAKVLTDPVRLQAESPRSEKRKIPQYYYHADSVEHKNKLLLSILKRDGVNKTIVFVKTREQLAQVCGFLDEQKVKSVHIQGEMEQERRMRAVSVFTKGECPLLIATDVASRGLDVPDVSHVINYDMPRTADVYVHRIGRTARAGKKGIAINLVEAHDFPMLSKVERYTGEKIEKRVVEGLEPQHRVPVFKKKKKEKDSKKKVALPKVRSRDKKNKGKPNFAAKKAAKMNAGSQV